ncbi:MAG: hypothetical protein WAN86_21970 [Hyphomicrobiaceae bacterium]
MGGTLGRIALGFIAAVIAVIVAHEAIIYGLTQAGLVRGTAWGMRPIPPWGVPRLVNNMFWGGLWGVLFALAYDWVPGRKAWLKGLIYGLFIAVVGSWVLVPLIKGRVFGQPGQVLFGGLNPSRMLSAIIIVGGFGLALGAIYDLLRPRPA